MNITLKEKNHDSYYKLPLYNVEPYFIIGLDIGKISTERTTRIFCVGADVINYKVCY